MGNGNLHATVRSGWLVMLLAAGCASPAAVQTQPIQTYEFRQVQERVQVALDPYFQVERARELFRTADQFPEAGLLPVQVIVENDGTGEVNVDPQEFRLMRPNGQQGVSLPPEDAFTLVKKAVGAWALLPILGQSAVGVQNDQRLKDFEARALRETKIQPGQSASGFVYFQVLTSDVNLAGSRVVCALQDGGGKKLTYEIPIAGRRDAPAQVAPASKAAEAKGTPISPGGPVKIEGTGGKGVIIRSPAP
jgi:hypothetical protein